MEGGINSHRSLGLLWTFVEHQSGKMHLESGASGRRGTPAGTGPEKIRGMILKTDTRALTRLEGRSLVGSKRLVVPDVDWSLYRDLG